MKALDWLPKHMDMAMVYKLGTETIQSVFEKEGADFLVLHNDGAYIRVKDIKGPKSENYERMYN
ncbi:hypothetical protein [Clostridium coskatii]|uniref:Uncharacterized protein n=1 Tax=Clostridium coskatii TaxID=1705578 RepID=A0A168PHM3_9CLOT|nr:hypothetical protein WX73_02701 [Clostridium coskatii]OBR91317.1 hypothetical protein CLCOS_35450 [Clostridium coskatii]